jgi:hypothetical protein
MEKKEKKMNSSSRDQPQLDAFRATREPCQTCSGWGFIGGWVGGAKGDVGGYEVDPCPDCGDGAVTRPTGSGTK